MELLDASKKLLRIASLQVKAVFYPGLKGCRGHEHAADLFSGFGGVVAAELEGGEEAASSFMNVRP